MPDYTVIARKLRDAGFRPAMATAATHVNRHSVLIRTVSGIRVVVTDR